MTSRYVMLEANRLRSIDINQREENDIYKNKWTNLVSSSGIPVNVGDTVNVQQIIVNTKGASDEVIEFTADQNEEGFVDNKTDLKFSYYINHTGRNTFALPSINSKTYIGNGTITNPVISDTTIQGGNITTYGTPNGAPNDSTIQVMLSRRSLGETLFGGTTVVNNVPSFFGNNQGITGNMINSYFDGGYLLRLTTKQTGFRTAAGVGGYSANTIYSAQIKIPTTTATGTVAEQFTVEVSDPVVANTQNFVIVDENAFNNAFPPITGYTLYKGASELGTIYTIERYRTAQLKLRLIPLVPSGGNALIPVSVTNADQLTAKYVSPLGPIAVGATHIGEQTGITIKVLTVTDENAPIANQVLTWEMSEADCFSPNIVTSSRTLILSALFVDDGFGYPELAVLTNTTFHEFNVNSVINQDSFMSSNDRKIDGSRYFLTNTGYTGLANKDETNVNTDALDTSTMVNNLDKRYNTTTLEIKPSFATPDNIASILTDQLKEPTKLSLENPLDNFLNYSETLYNYRSVQPLGTQLQYLNAPADDTKGYDDNSLIYRFQTGNNFAPDNRPAIVTTPTYKPMVANMYGHGLPNILFNGTKRNANQPSLAGQRRIFYDSVAYKEMNRVMSLKNAFYNFNYPKPTYAIEYLRDIYLGTQLSDYINRNDKNYGDFGTTIQSELGMRVCCLNNFYVDGKVVAPKNSLIVTNMKYNESNLARLSTAFRKTEQYLGNLNNVVDLSSTDYKNHLSVNLDAGMYCDELSVNGHLQFAQQNESDKPLNDPPKNAPPYPKNQRTKFIALSEITPTQTETIYPVDHTEGYICGAFQRNFLENDGQQLPSIWVKSRYQEGFTYSNSKNPPANYTGDKIEGITQFLTQQETGVYYASKYSEMNLNNDNQLGDYKYVSLTETDHTTILNFDASWMFTQPFRDGMTVVCTGGTINGVDITGKVSTISNVNLEAFVPPQPMFWLDQPFGTVTLNQQALNITIRIVTPEEQRFFNGTWTDDGSTIRDMDYAESLAKKYDLAVVPMFQPVLEQGRRCAGYHQTQDYEYQDEVPLIAFISNYELDMMEFSDFDTENLANPNNKWEIDSWNFNEGVQLGFDPSFTRNEAIAVCNINIGNFGATNKTSYENILMVGAVDPQINFDPSLSRFEFTGLNTPIFLGNGLASNLPQNLTATEAPEQQIFIVNQKGQIYPCRPKLIGQFMSGTTVSVSGRDVTNFSPVYNQFTTTQKPSTIMDSQCGIAIESLILYDTLGNKTEINEEDYDKFSGTLFSKLGFDLDQILIPIGSEQSFFTNNFTFQRKYTYKQSYNNIIKPLTTGTLISSSEIQSLSVNQLSMPMFDLGIDQIVKEIKPDATQGSITAFGLPTKLDYPYLVVYSDINGGSSNTEFFGGIDSQSMIPAVAYIYRNENNGDFFYGLESDITFTCVKDYVITEVDIDIRLPDGKRPRLSKHSAVIFKITKPLQVPYPNLILNQKK